MSLSQEMHKLQLENQRLQKQLLEQETARAQAALAAKKTRKNGKAGKDDDDDDDDPIKEYIKPAHVFGLLGNPWVSTKMLERPRPTIDPESPARYADSLSRSEGELAELYAAFPENLRSDIRLKSEIRKRVCSRFCLSWRYSHNTQIADIISAQRSTKINDMKLSLDIIYAEYGPDVTSALVGKQYDHPKVAALLKGTGKAYGMRFPPIMFPADAPGDVNRIFQSDTLTNASLILYTMYMSG